MLQRLHVTRGRVVEAIFTARSDVVRRRCGTCNQAIRATFPAEHQFGARVVAEMRKRGVLVTHGIPLGPRGEHVDVMRTSPLFVIAEEHLDTIVGTLDEAIATARTAT